MQRFNAHILEWRDQWWCLYPTGVLIPCLGKEGAQQMAAYYNRALCKGIVSDWLWWRGLRELLDKLDSMVGMKWS
jgi:hypothetical protein